MNKNNMSQKHHCIPQFYLKQFGNRQINGSFITNIYNKNNGKKFTNSISNVSYLKDYNTIEINGVKSDMFEQLHNSVYEKKYSKRLRIIINDMELFFKNIKIINCLTVDNQKKLLKACLSSEDKVFLSNLLAYFIRRSKKMRYFEEGIYDKMYNMMDNVYNSLNLDRNKFEANVIKEIGNKEQLKVGNLLSCFKEKDINIYAICFYNHLWNIGYNISSHYFYTSDNAHALTTMKADSLKIFGIGYATPGNIIIFPLSPKLCVIMYDPNQLEIKKRIKDCKYVYLDEIIVKSINQEIAYNAIDEVYSIDGDWKHLNELIDTGQLPLGHKPYSIN